MMLFKTPKTKILKWIFLSFGTLFLLISCDGCGCETVHKGPTFDINAEWMRFGSEHVMVVVDDYTYEQCSSLSGGGGPGTDATKYYALGLEKNEILDITEGQRQWYAIDDDKTTYGKKYFEMTNSNDGMDFTAVGPFRLRIQRVEGQFQTWIFDPYAKPQVHKLGGLWGKDYVENTPFEGPYSFYPIRVWSKDTVLIDLGKKDINAMDSNVVYYYLQSLKTGNVVPMNFKGD